MDSLMELSDSVAVAQARAGDSGAFRVLVERHSRNLFRLAYRMTGHQQDAEDVVQETFLRAYRQLSKLDERASFGTWLYRIAANCSLDLIRNRPPPPGAGRDAGFAAATAHTPRGTHRGGRPGTRVKAGNSQRTAAPATTAP